MLSGLLVLVGFGGAAWASPDCPNNNNGGQCKVALHPPGATPPAFCNYKTIQAAIDDVTVDGTKVIVEPGLYSEGLSVTKSLDLVAADGTGDCADTTSGTITVEVSPSSASGARAISIVGGVEPIDVNIEDVGFLYGEHVDFGGTMNVANATVDMVNGRLLTGDAPNGGCLHVQLADVSLTDVAIGGCKDGFGGSASAVRVLGATDQVSTTSLTMAGGSVAGSNMLDGIYVNSGDVTNGATTVDLGPVHLLLDDAWVHDVSRRGVAGSGSDATLELRGSTVVESAGGTGVLVVSEASLTAYEDVEIRGNAGGSLGSGVTGGGGVLARFESTVNLFGNAWVHDNDADHGGGIYADGNSSVEMYGSALVSDNTADTGGGIEVRDCDPAVDLVVRGSARIFNNVATAEGGGIWADACDVRLEDFANVDVNSATAGGGVRMASGQVRVLESSSLSLNSATGDGGGISLESGASALIKDNAELFLNHCGGSGGGVHATSGVVQVHNEAVLQSNHCDSDGGGIFQLGGTLEILDSATFFTNHADGDGGAIHATGATVTVSTPDGVIRFGNNSATDGAGMWLGTSATTISTGPDAGRVWVFGGDASGDGGGIWVGGGTLTSTFDLLVGAPLDLTTNTPFAGFANIADERGGGIYAELGAVLTLDGHMWWLDDSYNPLCASQAATLCPVAELGNLGFPKVVGNSANAAGSTGVAGAGFYLDGASLSARNLVVSHNDADPADGYPAVSAAGGGFALTNAASLLLSSTTVHLNEAGLGGGMYLDGGSSVITDTYGNGLAPLGGPENTPLGDTCEDRVVIGEAPFDREKDRYCTEVSFNSAGDGAGVHINGSAAVLENVGLIGNDVDNYQAAVGVVAGGSVDLRGSLVADNQARRGAVLVTGSSDLIATATTFSQEYDVYVASSTATIDNSILWHNSWAGLDMLILNSATGVGDCNMGQGVVLLTGSNNDEDADPNFLTTVPETDYFPGPGTLAWGQCAPGAGVAFDLFGFSGHQVDRGAFKQ